VKQHSRQYLGIIVGLAVAVSAACSRDVTAPTSPSAERPLNLNHSGGGAHKHFTVTISPSTVAANQSNVVLTVTVTNCGAATPGCTDGASTQNMGSAEIVVPAGFTVTNVGNFGGSQAWATSWVSGNTVVVGANVPAEGTKKLTPGQFVTFDVTVTTPLVCDTYALPAAPHASNSTLPEPPVFGTDWEFYGTVPSIIVNSCVAECPAAPSIAAHYLHFTLNIHPGSSSYQNIVSQVAHEMGPDATFHGIGPCEAGYAAAVIAFVNSIL
jgi:hypothetical protein